MTIYSISEPDRPWIMLFSTTSLDAVAEALAAQEEFDPSSIRASLDGKSRSVNDEETIALFGRVLELRPDDPVAVSTVARAPGLRDRSGGDSRRRG